MSEQWKISGDMILNCSCTVFCPCVVSLGEHPSTEGNCQAWMGINIEDGFHGDTSLTGPSIRSDQKSLWRRILYEMFALLRT